jgi:predicted transcriptional regulator of viral defense system
MSRDQSWQPRSEERVADEVWQATMTRVRGEFEEMPCMRVTPEQACALMGLQPPVSTWVLHRLTEEGFLSRTGQGEYMRRPDAT